MTVFGLAAHRCLIHAQALMQLLPALGHDQHRACIACAQHPSRIAQATQELHPGRPCEVMRALGPVQALPRQPAPHGANGAHIEPHVAKPEDAAGATSYCLSGIGDAQPKKYPARGLPG